MSAYVYGDSGYLGAGNREDAIVRNKSGRKIKYKIKASPHNCVCGLRPIFCPIRAVIKGGNTYSIPALL